MAMEIGRYDLEWIEVAPFIEDIEPIPNTGWLLAAAMRNPFERTPGRLYLVDTRSGQVSELWPGSGTVSPSGEFQLSEPVNPDHFTPHGIALDAPDRQADPWRLYVVHHGVRESIRGVHARTRRGW